ncbi:MAG TPA: FHA domain-containing protein [Rhodanobacteraceae bacterium]|nr:FHA domain-containing protein [Rhodanobacteraceae bacterium]
MRVVCVRPARDPVWRGAGPVRIGSAPDDDVVPVGAGVDPHHVSIAADARGLVLDVGPGCRRVYVNARAVRERALLRYGDTLTLGANKFLLMTDTAPTQINDADRVDHTAESASRVMLRIVSGHASGQALAVAPEVLIGAGSRHFGELPCRCRVARNADGLILESESDMPRVNGWRCRRTKLASGDQIVLGEHRLVVEAPALQYAAHVAALPTPAVTRTAPEPDTSPHTEIWWLIAAAATLAVIIALALYFRW